MKKTLIIDGMMCEKCAERVKKTLEAIKGVNTAVVSLPEKKAEVECALIIDPRELSRAITEAGYTVVEIL